MENFVQGLANTLNLKYKDTTLFGKYHGFYVRIDVFNERYHSVLVSAFSLESKGDMYGYLENKKHDDVIDEYTVNNGVVVFSYNAENEQHISLNDVLREFTGLLLKNDYTTVCTACNEVKESSFYDVNGKIKILCTACSGKIEQAIAAEKNKSGNYVMGFIGAFIGAMIGSLLWIGIGYIGFYASIAGYAIAYASFYGYTFVKGLNSKIGVAINVVSIVFALLLAEYIGIMLQILKEYPDLSIVQYIFATPALFSDPEFLTSIVPNLGLGLVFAGLGSHKIIRSMLESAQSREGLNFQAL